MSIPGYDVEYIPEYGVEAYKSVGGLDGAEVTNDNFLIGLWGSTNKITAGVDPSPVGFSGSLVPKYVNEPRGAGRSLPLHSPRAHRLQGFPSRPPRAPRTAPSTGCSQSSTRRKR